MQNLQNLPKTKSMKMKLLGEIIANSLDWSMLSKQEAKTISEDASLHEEGQQFLTALENEYGSLGAIISEKPPQISIEVRDGKIIITDQGVGMNHEELEIALKLKMASDRIRAPLRMRKGQFGMGLKSASKSLGTTLEIHSRSIKSPGETIVFMHKDEQMQDRTNWTDFKGYRTTEKEASSPLGSQEHGTSIIISSLTRKLSNDDVLDAREELCEIFHYE